MAGRPAGPAGAERACCPIGTADTFLHEAGDQEYARRYFGLTPEAIVKRVLGALLERSPEGRNGAVRLAGLSL